MTMNLTTLPPPSDFEAYARMAHQIPMLSLDEEQQAMTRWHNHRDPAAAKTLVMAHLRLVVKAVRAHQGYGLPRSDLAQEGTVGLMKAVHRFNPSLGVRLGVYAWVWIQAEIREFILSQWRMVKLSGQAAKKLFFGYRKAMAQLLSWKAGRLSSLAQTDEDPWAEIHEDHHEEHDEMNTEELALVADLDACDSLNGEVDVLEVSKPLLLHDVSSKAMAPTSWKDVESHISGVLNVKPEEVRQASLYFYGKDMSISGCVDQDEDSSQQMDRFDPHRSMRTDVHHEAFEGGDPALAFEEAHDEQVYINQLKSALNKLSPREQMIVQQRHLTQPAISLSLLSQELGVSIERVRQIEQQALNKIKHTMGMDGSLIQT